MRQEVGGNLIVPELPIRPCLHGDRAACDALFRDLKNPYLIGDQAALTQTTAWVGAWSTQPSAYVVAARRTEDVVAAVRFARAHGLRVVIKGGGHSYFAGSNAPDSLMVWTRAMDVIEVHDGFVPQGGAGRVPPAEAVSVGAGTIWMRTYDAVTTKAGRYVQGGECGTVGVAGLVQGGGFGTHSKAFGTADASLLEAKVVTADGAVQVANAFQEPELFWALKGGGGGSCGVMTRLTLHTRALPRWFETVSTGIHAKSAEAYRRLLAAFVAFYADALCNPHWGELVRAMPGFRLEIGMNFHGLDRDRAEAVWRPFLAWVAAQDELTATHTNGRKF